MPVHTASGGAEATIEVAAVYDGYKRGWGGAGTTAQVDSYGDGFKTGWMQWPVEGIATPEAGGLKSIIAGFAEVLVKATLLLRQPLGHTSFTVFPSGTRKQYLRFK